MAIWNKIRFYYDAMLGSTGSTLTASSTATGDYSANYIYNMMETNGWKAGSLVPPAILTYDAGAGNAKTADYIAIIGHNFYSAGASVYLEWSDDNVSWTTGWSATPTSDAVLLGEFTQTAGHRYWRLRLFKSPSNFTAAPYVAICIWGNRTEIDYASTSFDPYGQEVKANINLTQNGYNAGTHILYTERNISLTFDDADSILYGKIKSWWDSNGLKQFFMSWDTANNASDVWLVYADKKHNNPLTNGGSYRTINLSLKGRKE